MKKILTAFFLSVALMFAGLLCLNVNAAETAYSYTFTQKVFSKNDTKSLGDFEWKLSGEGGYWGYDPTKGQQFGSESKPYTQLTLETTSEISNVSKIVVNASTASSAKASLVVSVGTTTGTKKTLSTTATDYSYEFDPKVSGVISIKINQSTSKALYIKSISITYESNEPYSISFDATDTKSSLIVTYDEELNPTDVDLRLGGVITTDSYLAGATYGVLVTTGTVDLTAGKTTYATVAEFIAANKGFKNVTCTPAQVETGYQFAWVITDMEGNYNTSLTAVMYMVYDGALYICKSKTTSVKDTASQYIEDAGTLGLTEEQKNVLGKLVAYYGGNNNE